MILILIILCHFSIFVDLAATSWRRTAFKLTNKSVRTGISFEKICLGASNQEERNSICTVYICFDAERWWQKGLVSQFQQPWYMCWCAMRLWLPAQGLHMLTLSIVSTRSESTQIIVNINFVNIYKIFFRNQYLSLCYFCYIFSLIA